MTVQWSTAVRNAILAGWESAIGTSAIVEMRTGPPPANTLAAAGGTLVASFMLAADWAAAPAGGSVALADLPVIAQAVADGTIGHYRILNTSLATCHEQGTVTATGGGGDLTVDNPAVTAGQSIQITAWTKTAPGV